jgi:hypothetical protein
MSAQLPQKLPIDLMQQRWASQLNPVLANLLVQGQLLPNIVLLSGANVINHKLGRDLIGWFITRKNDAANIYDTQDINQMPDLTLNLTSDMTVKISVWVF